MEAVMTTGAISHAKLQTNHHHQQTSASDWLGRLVYEMTCNVLMGTLNPAHSLSHPPTHQQTIVQLFYKEYAHPIAQPAVSGHWRKK